MASLLFGLCCINWLGVVWRALPPSDPPEHETGLVVGYVQSGKTLSFETVISLARDNGYGIVIVLSLLQSISGGTSVLALISTIETSIAAEPKMREKLWANVINDLGSDFSASLDRRFDTSYADRNLNIFLMEDIPKPSTSSDPPITAIRFLADCTGVKSSIADFSKDGLRAIFECN